MDRLSPIEVGLIAALVAIAILAGVHAYQGGRFLGDPPAWQQPAK